MIMLLWSTIITTLVGLASAAVIPRDSGFKTLSQPQISGTDTYANYAAAALCSPASLTYWNCGGPCQGNPTFELYGTGGDGQKVPQWFAGYDNNLDSIIVSHQGNDGQKFFTGLANAQGAFTALDPSIFPNITSAIQVYGPIANAHAKSVSDVLQVLGNLIGAYPNADVTVIGYSMGGSIALLDGLLFRMLLAPTTNVKVVSYGMSRVGNQAFSSFVDSMLPGTVKRIVNKRDPYPVVPGLSLGYHGVDGEIHIQQNGKWTQCPGDDNGDSRCIAGTVTSINNANFADHVGPYDNIMMTCNS